MKKFVCQICGYVYEGEAAPEYCPQCKAPASKFTEMCGDRTWAAEHIVGIAKDVAEDIKMDLRANFTGECTEVGMYLAMSRVAHREGYPEIGLYWEKAAYEEAEHAAKFCELLGECVWDTETNLKKRMEEEIAAGHIWFGSDGNGVPRKKTYLADRAGKTMWTWWPNTEVGHTQEAKKELIATVDFPNSDVVFDTPKPTRLLRRILQLATSPDGSDLVLDFFAGTGSMMDAVFQQNAEDGGKRRCILVQLPEPLEGGEVAGWTSIADITRARLVGAGKRHRTADPMFAGDVGFRNFKLDTSNIRAWNPNVADIAGTLLANLEHIESGRSENDVLYEVLLKLGLDLCVHADLREIAGKPVHSIGGGTLMACLDEHISVTDAEPLALGIAAWREELATAGATTAVFRDSAFENDVAKSNLAAILEQHGVKHVRSL